MSHRSASRVRPPAFSHRGPRGHVPLSHVRYQVPDVSKRDGYAREM
jgi:hypothetical protein